jgi:DGQHR domain-containing protein
VSDKIAGHNKGLGAILTVQPKLDITLSKKPMSKQEKRVATFFKKLKFASSRVIIKEIGGRQKRELDLVVITPKGNILVACKSGSHVSVDKEIKLLYQTSNQVKNYYNLTGDRAYLCKNIRIRLLVVPTATPSEKEYARSLGVTVWGDYEFKENNQFVKLLGLDRVTTEFRKYYLKLLGFDIKLRDIVVDNWIKIKQKKNKPFAVFQIQPLDLLKVAWIERHVKEHPLGYQRRLNPTRISEISKFYNLPHAILPNAIIANFQNGFKIKKKRLHIPQVPETAWIIDGQHRLYSFIKSNKQFPIICVGFDDLDFTTARELFVEINDNQKRIPAMQLCSLYAQMKKDVYQHTKNPKVRASYIVDRLSGHGIWKHRIRGEPWEAKSEQTGQKKVVTRPINMSSFAFRSLIELIKEPKGGTATAGVYQHLEDDVIAEHINEYFIAISKTFPRYWGTDKILMGNSGVNIMLLFLQNVENYRAYKKLTQDRKGYITILKRVKKFKFTPRWDSGSAKVWQKARNKLKKMLDG